MQGIWVLPLVRELKSHRPRNYELEHATACAPQSKIPHSTMKIRCSQISRYIKKPNNLQKYIIYKKHLVKQKRDTNSHSWQLNYFLSFFSHIFLNFHWGPITLQYCSGFCHTFTWISHECTCIPHPEPPATSLPIPSFRVIPVHQLWAPCLMHWTWIGNLFHIW